MATETPAPETDPSTRRRPWRRRILKVVAALVVLLLLAPLALSLGPVRSMVAGKIGDALGAPVSIDGLSGYWFAGIDLEGISVASPAGYEKPVATVESVHLDVGVLGLLAGNVDADVTVTRPVLTIRQTAGGGSNLDAIKAKLRSQEDRTDEAGGEMSLRLTLRDGLIDAQGAHGVEPTRVEALNLAATVGAAGALRLAFDAVAPGARVGGGDAPLKAELAVDAGGRGPWMISTARLDLSRFSALLAGVGALRRLSGELEIEGRGDLRGPGQVEGKAVAGGGGIRAELYDGGTLEVATLTATVTGGRTETESTFGIDVDLAQLALTQPTATGTLRFAEPVVTIDAAGTYQPDARRVIVRDAQIAAGATLDAKAEKPWMISYGDVITAQGLAKVTADFARLGSLRSLSPELERIVSGNLVANVNARQGDGLDVSIGARVLNLSVTSPLPGGPPYREPDVVLQARYGRVGPSHRVDLYRLTSTLVSSSGTGIEAPLVVHLRPGNVLVNGPVDLRLDMRVLSLLVPDQLGLEAGETVDGQVSIVGNASGTDAKSTLEATLTGRGIRLPARLDDQRTPGNLDATIRADMTADDLKLVLQQLRGFGLTEGTGTVHLLTRGEEMRLGDSTIALGLNAAVARPWLRPLMGLDRQARFAGQLTVNLQTVERDGGLVLKGTSHADSVFWQPTPADLALRDSRVSVEHDLWLAPEGGRSTVAKLALGVTGLTVDVRDSTFAVSEGSVDLDVKGTLRGDAARLAPTVASLMGPDYADMRGAGAIQGTFRATGSPRRGGEDLLLDVTVGAGSWSSGGLAIESTQVTARRAALQDPVAGALNARFNKGPTTLSGTYRPGPKRTPWTLSLNAADVDTSSLLVDRGPARFLAFALPATLPSDASVPVLSGLLSARADLQSGDLSDPAMLDELRGNGRIQMQEGEIKNSTLFGGGKGSQLGKALAALAVAVPEVGDVVTSVTRALTFQSLDSMFSIATRRVDLQQARLVGRYVSILTKGVVTFERQVNLKTDLTFEGSAGKKVEKYLPDRTVPLRVTGTLPNTQVTPSLDLSKLAGQGLLDRAKDLLDGKKPKDIVKDLRDLIK